jgi:hypothetical protein
MIYSSSSGLPILAGGSNLEDYDMSITSFSFTSFKGGGPFFFTTFILGLGSFFATGFRGGV